MTEDRLVEIITRQLFGEPHSDDARVLEDWVNASAKNAAFLGKFTDEGLLELQLRLWNNIDPKVGFENWRRGRRNTRIRQIFQWSAAAVILLTVAVGIVIRREDSKNLVVAPRAMVPISTVPPGKNTAVLTLANGQNILLDSIGDGELVRQGRTRIIKKDDQSLSYLAGTNDATPLGYNVLSTPRAGQYRLVLPDGSRVWLNNVTKLRYPTSFQGMDRTVELSGEAYFEITRDPSKPFIVKVRDEAVEVLGTSFNIMAYPEESGTQTTLLTGAVAVKTDESMVRLKPGEQAQVGDRRRLRVIKDVASSDIISWKDGFFYFGRASFASMMRQLARWYDVDVIYEGKAPDVEFGGKLDRNLPLNDLLKFLDKNQIHFRLEGRKLIVLPN